MIGWDDILDKDLSTNAGIYQWHYEDYSKEAVARGSTVVMSPMAHTYFDYHQFPIRNDGYHYFKFWRFLFEVYNWNPAEGIEEKYWDKILGVNACDWGMLNLQQL
jgi:hexosaminidase